MEVKRKSDRVLGVILLVLAGVIVWGSTLIEESFIQDPLGPKAFPVIIALVLAVSALVLIIRPDSEPEWPRLAKLLEIFGAIAVMVLYAQFLPVIGFVFATAIAAAYLSWRLGSSVVSALIAGVVIAVGIYVIFHLILGLSLARGPLGF